MNVVRYSERLPQLIPDYPLFAVAVQRVAWVGCAAVLEHCASGPMMNNNLYQGSGGAARQHWREVNCVRRIGKIQILLSAAAVLVGFAPPAFAYLDPSTGSMIISAVLGVLATVGLAAKTYWYKLKSVFRRGNARRNAGSEPPQTTDPDSAGES